VQATQLEEQLEQRMVLVDQCHLFISLKDVLVAGRHSRVV
ncbi:hypothetical protein L195_g061330, partial [Trifolium pratense]